MATLFFLVSGEHPTLPFSEVKAILEAEGHRYRVVGQLRQVFRVDADVECVDSIVRRAALTRACGSELFSVKANVGEIFAKCYSTSFGRHIRKDKTFVVRVRRIGESAPEIDSVELEQKIGEIILDRVKGIKVRLTDPDVAFLGILTGDVFVFGRRLAEIPAKPFVERRPRKRPFFHPSAMPAKLARCMVNLAQPEAGDVVLDPFCGTASMLIEAGLIGCRVVGFDVQWRMVRGSLRNLQQYGVEADGVLRADARYPPVHMVDCVVTDPPYGRSAKTLGREVGDIVRHFLSIAEDCVPRGRRVCVAFPKGVEIGKMTRSSGFKLVESHYVYIHRSLTREIAVLERV